VKQRPDTDTTNGSYGGKRKPKRGGRYANHSPSPSYYESNDSLNTSMFAGPFRKPKNLTDSLGTASKVARKYRKLGSK
jgi:hypothetical protein